MANKVPALLRQNDSRNVVTYRFSVSSDFPTPEWVPTLANIQAAKTFGEQHQALGSAILCVNGSGYGFRQISGGRIRPIAGDMEVRFRWGDEVPRLSYITIGSIAVGYQSSDRDNPNPAFAVLDSTRVADEDIHEVIRDPSEPLTELGIQLGKNTIDALTDRLDSRYPGFEIRPKLHDALLALSE